MRPSPGRQMQRPTTPRLPKTPQQPPIPHQNRKPRHGYVEVPPLGLPPRQLAQQQRRRRGALAEAEQAVGAVLAEGVRHVAIGRLKADVGGALGCAVLVSGGGGGGTSCGFLWWHGV
jgi:hypothetical protein